MFDGNQVVQIKWNNTNKDWYESKGYTYTKRYDSFDIFAKDLSPSSRVKIKAKCDYCNNDYDTQFAVLINGRKIIPKDCCSNCTGKKSSNVSKQKRAIKKISLAKQICEKNNYQLITTIEEYTDAKMNVRFICPKHGEQTMSLDNLIRGHKCIKCSYEERGKKLRHDIEYIKSTIESINNNILLNPYDYIDTHTNNLNIQCSCGKTFTTSFSNYTKYNVNKCYSCSCKESLGEQRIREFLESHNIKFEQEKRFEDCRDIKPLPFDFYLPEYIMCIEFDDPHHYKNIYFNNHEITKKHDKIKNEYCQKHNIDLLRISYLEGDNIKDIISKKLNL